VTDRRVNPFAFVVGCARSGTTLVRRILDAHPRVAITPETHWIAKLDMWADDGPGAVTEDLVERLLSAYEVTERLWTTPEEVRALVAGRPVSVAEFVSAVFDAYGRRRGRSLVGDKTPGYVMHIRRLDGLWPDARFVHVIRDGRDVCLSALRWKGARKLEQRYRSWQADPVVAAAFWWKRRVRTGQEDGSALGPERYQELFYERLVEDPEARTRELCSFLRVDFEPAILRFHEAPVRLDRHGRRVEKAWKPVTSGLRNWRTEMAASDVERFEAAAGDLLDELGYERAAPTPGRSARDRAGEIKDLFVRDVLAVGHRLPPRW